MNITFGYARVSTRSQKTDPQIDLLKEAGCDQIFEETSSGANRQRPQLDTLLTKLRKGDTLVVVKLDRLSRSLSDLLWIVDRLRDSKANLRSLQGPQMDTTSPLGKLILAFFGMLAEFEREMIRSRTIEGLAAARARGQRLGRTEALSSDQKEELYALCREGLSQRQLAKKFGVSKTTIIRYLKIARELGIPLEQSSVSEDKALKP